ncbi:MAG: hypothetical protein ACP5QT_01715 [Brevinematia bacterium]
MKENNKLKKLKTIIFERIKKEGISNLSKILEEEKNRYFFLINKKVRDPEQSWKPFKGRLLEEILLNYLQDELKNFNIQLIKGDELNKEKLSDKLEKVKKI